MSASRREQKPTEGDFNEKIKVEKQIEIGPRDVEFRVRNTRFTPKGFGEIATLILPFFRFWARGSSFM